MNVVAEFAGAERLRPGWRLVRLGEIVREAQAGFATSSRSEDGVIQLRMNNVTTSGSLDWSAYIHVPVSPWGLAKYKLLRGDIVFNNTNSVDLVGKSALVEDLDEPTVYSSHFTRLRFNGQAEAAYVALWLNFQWRQRLFAEICNRWVGQAAVQRAKLLSLEIPLPSLSEQRRIAAALDTQLAEVARGRAAAEQQLRAINRGEAALTQEVFGILPISTEHDEPAPAGWAWSLLTDVARLESGHTPSRRHPEWWGGEVPWIALPDIRSLDGRIAQDTIEKTNAAGLANSSARLLPEGTVVLSRTASVGFVTVMGRPMATSQDFVNWVCGPMLRPWFLAQALIAARDYLHSLASGAIHKTIYIPTVKSLRICLPPLAEQDRILQHIESIRQTSGKARNAAMSKIVGLDALPSSLLRAAFRGGI